MTLCIPMFRDSRVNLYMFTINKKRVPCRWNSDDSYFDVYSYGSRRPSFMDGVRVLTRPLMDMFSYRHKRSLPSDAPTRIKRSARRLKYLKKYNRGRQVRQEERILQSIQENDVGKCGQKLVCQLSSRQALTQTERQILSFVW